MLWEVLLGAIFLFLLWQTFRKPPGLPPGRWGLPLLGYIPFFSSKSMFEHLSDLHKEHGDVFIWRMGMQLMVFLHDYQLCKEAYSKADFVDKPVWDLITFIEEKPLGVFAASGTTWQNNRRFSLRQLRDLGMGKSKLVAAVQYQANYLVECLKKQADKPQTIPHALNLAVVNIIWHMVGGKHFEESDPFPEKFEKTFSELLAATNLIAIPDFLPWIRYCIPNFFLRLLCKIDRLEKLKEDLFIFFGKVIKEHKATLDRDNPRDLIDGYLMDMEDRKDDPESHCSERDLVLLVFDMFFAGSGTTTSTITWMVYYLAMNPEVQCKVQAEIDEVLPKGTQAVLGDRVRMPYTDATIQETLRKSALLSLGGLHVAVRDTELGGYTIPKGAVLNFSMKTIHNDPQYWDQPDKFLPERWLDENGKFVAKKDGFLAFGVGKRSCIGEGLARMELFIFATTLLQNLSFSCPPGTKLDIDHLPLNPLINSPKAQEVVVSVR